MVNVKLNNNHIDNQFMTIDHSIHKFRTKKINTMLTIKNLHAGIEGKEILKGINLEIKPGEVHAIMGPNGSGKSTLASVLAGRAEYEVTEGRLNF